LEREGLVTNEPGRGFLVARLEAREVQELYPMRALLEPLALRLAGLPDHQTLVDLRKLTQKLVNTAAGRVWVATDDRWHALLVHACPNQHLLRLIRDLHRHAQRYEYAFIRSSNNLAASVEQRQRVLAELEAGDLEEACSQLANSMLVDVEAVLDGLNQR
jgi:DNA-binding GntR family transcriptional regulator